MFIIITASALFANSKSIIKLTVAFLYAIILTVTLAGFNILYINCALQNIIIVLYELQCSASFFPAESGFEDYKYSWKTDYYLPLS